MKNFLMLVVVSVVSVMSLTAWDQAYFRGTTNDWDSESMSLNSETGLWETEQSFESRDSDGGPRFKIDRYGDWVESYPTADYEVDEDTSYKITFNDSTNEILIDIVDEKPKVTVSKDAGSYTDDSISVTIEVSGDDITESMYKVDEDSWQDFDSSETIVLDMSDLLSDETKYLYVYAENSVGVTEVTYIYTRKILGSGLNIYFENSYSWSNVYIYAYLDDDDLELYTDSWPGNIMTTEGDDWFKEELETDDGAKIIFNDGSDNQIPSSGSAGTLRTSDGWYNGVWNDSDPRVDTEAPVISVSPDTGNREETSLDVTLTATDNSDSNPTIYYTLDGDEPTVLSDVYTDQFTIYNNGSGTNATIKAIGVDSSDNISEVYTFEYYLDEDATAPEITINPDPGRYTDTQYVTISITDNRDQDPVIYYTTDGTVPEEISEDLYSGDTITLNNNKTIKVLGVDSADNIVLETFSYYIGEVTTTRFDPRQESIYFLLTARWFDGDLENSVGDEWCSWTEERENDSIDDDGFTGSEDVTWRGDFKGLVEKMDYIKALGFTTIWITPIVQNRSPLAYHGYHGWDFTKEDERLVSEGYGFQRVIDEAHARDMKICLDVVINHSGRMGIKDHSEIKYATDSSLYPQPDEWASWSYDEDDYQNNQEQSFPEDWTYDGLTSPGSVDGEELPPYARFGDIRSFTNLDLISYPYLYDVGSSGYMIYQWPTTESYVYTIDNWPGCDLTLEEYGNLPSLWHRAYMNGFNDSGMFDTYPDANLRTIHEDCPELNTESTEVQEYMLDAYYRYIDMGVDMFRVDTLMHIDKQTVNEMYWPQLLERAEESKDARGGSDFFIFGEVANFVNNLSDKPAELQQPNYTWDETISGCGNSSNHLLNGNSYREPDYSHKSPEADSPYNVSVIDLISHNGFADGVYEAYRRALSNDYAYNDATFLTWYTDSHDYGPNKGETRWDGDFASAWSMLFTFRGIPIVYYGSEIRFAAGLPNDWPGGGSSGTEMSLEKTGRAYYGEHLAGNVSASDFGEYTADGEVAETLSGELAQHLMGLNKIRLAVPALQMGQYSTDGHSGGWAGYKRRYTGINKLTGESIDSYVLVGVGEDTHSWSGVLNGTYVDCVTGNQITASDGSVSFTVNNGGEAGLGVYVLKGLTTSAPGQIDQDSPFLY